MKTKKTIGIGLAFPNALFIGILFASVGAYFIITSYFGRYPNSSDVSPILGFVFVILGLIPVTAHRKLKINNTTKKIQYYMTILFFFKIGKSYRIDSFDTVLTGSKSRTYATGGGFLYSAKSFYKMKQSDIWILKKGTKNKIEIRNVSSLKKVKQIIDKLKIYTDYQVNQ